MKSKKQKTNAAIAVKAEPVTALDPLDVPGGDESEEFIRHLFTASGVSRDNATLFALNRANNQASAVLDGLHEWARREGMAIAAQAIRWYMNERGATPKLRRPRTVGKVELSEEAARELELQPFFTSREEATVLRSVLPLSYQRKWAAYFAAFGCLKCERKDVVHDSCGLCATCRARINARLARAKWEREPNGQPCPPLEEDNAHMPALPPSVETPKARHCDACGQHFKPMTDGVWKSIRAAHELSRRHLKAVKRRKGEAA